MMLHDKILNHCQRFGHEIFLICILFFYFYNIPLQYFGLPFSSGKLITIVSVLYLLQFLLFPEKGKININYLKYCLGVVFLLGIVFSINNIYYSTNDSYYLTIVLYYIIEYLFGAIFICALLSKYNFTRILDILIKTGVVQACVMVSAAMLPGMKRLVFDILDANAVAANFSAWKWEDNAFRGLALASDARLGMAIFFSSMIMLIYVNLLQRQTISGYFKYVVYFLLLCIGGTLAARTFFIGFGLGLVMLIAILINYKNGARFLKKYFRKISVSLLLIIIATPLIINLFFSEYAELFSVFSDWAFEIFINLGSKGTLTTDSSSDLFETHLKVIPHDWHTILIGDTNRTFLSSGVHYMGAFTDSGYLRMVYVYGILGSLAHYLFWIYILYKAGKYFSRKEGMRYFFFFLGLNLFICQVKYDVFPGSSLNFKLIVLFLVFGIERMRMLKQNTLPTLKLT